MPYEYALKRVPESIEELKFNLLKHFEISDFEIHKKNNYYGNYSKLLNSGKWAYCHACGYLVKIDALKGKLTCPICHYHYRYSVRGGSTKNKLPSIPIYIYSKEGLRL